MREGPLCYPTVQRTFATDPGTPAAARQWLRQVLTAAAPTVDLEIVLLLSSELVSNAIQHGDGSTVQVQIKCDRSRVIVGVTDESPEVPRLLRARDDAPSGRGIALVDRVADRWGVATNDHGKRVWFEVAAQQFPSGIKER